MLIRKTAFRESQIDVRMSNVQQQRMVVEQLRREASIKRISVSQAVEDIKVRPLSLRILLSDSLYQQFLKTKQKLHHCTWPGKYKTKVKILSQTKIVSVTLFFSLLIMNSLDSCLNSQGNTTDINPRLVQKFVVDNQISDCLLVGFSSERANPFREKSWSCQII